MTHTKAFSTNIHLKGTKVISWVVTAKKNLSIVKLCFNETKICIHVPFSVQMTSNSTGVASFLPSLTFSCSPFKFSLFYDVEPKSFFFSFSSKMNFHTCCYIPFHQFFLLLSCTIFWYNRNDTSWINVIGNESYLVSV